MNKKYLVLGSCRVVNTVANEINNNVTVINKNDLWFTHYIQEHIQKIKHLFNINPLPEKEKELFVRFEQKNHYKNKPELGVADSLINNKTKLCNDNSQGVLNVVVELPTTRYIKISYNDNILWGHSGSLKKIRESPFKLSSGLCDDADFIKLLAEFEQIILELALHKNLAESVNFIYVPHSPFIESEEGIWETSEQRAHISDLIRQYCLKENTDSISRLPVQRCFLNIGEMIQKNGGVRRMLKDQNHYSPVGRRIAYKYISELAL